MKAGLWKLALLLASSYTALGHKPSGDQCDKDITPYPQCPGSSFNQWKYSNLPKASIDIEKVEWISGDDYSVTVHFVAEENLDDDALWELKIMTPVNKFINSVNGKVHEIDNPKDFTYTFETTIKESSKGEYCVPAVSFQFDWCSNSKKPSSCKSWKYDNSYDYYTGCQDTDHKIDSTYCFKKPSCDSSSSSAPASSAPESSAPASSTPESSAPASSTPESSAPESSAPASSTPESSAPESSAPASSTPESSAPESSAPASSTPESSAPESSAPASSAPESSAPESSAPESSAPASSAPESSAPAPSTSATPDCEKDITPYPQCPDSSFNQWKYSNLPKASIDIEKVEWISGDDYSVTVHFVAEENLDDDALWELKIMTPVNKFINSVNGKVHEIDNPKDFTYTFETTIKESSKGEYCVPAVSFQFDWCSGSKEPSSCKSWKYDDSYDYYTGCQDTDHKIDSTYCFKKPSCDSSSSSAPASSTPASSAPESSAPASSTPESSAPASSAPESSAPESSAPASSTPESSAPASSTPESSAPASSAPESSAPASSAPESSAPASSAPESSAPASSAPESSAPASSAPESSAPASSTPESSAPASSAPESSAPASSAPESSAPASSAPESSAPASSTPESSAPASSAPESSAPASSAPESSAPASSAPITSSATSWSSTSPDSTLTETITGTTVVTVTSCEDQECTLTTKTTGYVVVTESATTYTTYCPLTTTSEEESQKTLTTSEEESQKTSTITKVQPTTITVTTCDTDSCYPVEKTTGYVVVTESATTYTTYCPLTTSEEESQKTSTITKVQPTKITVTTCDTDSCYPVEKTTGYVVVTEGSSAKTSFAPLPTETVSEKSGGVESYKSSPTTVVDLSTPSGSSEVVPGTTGAVEVQSTVSTQIVGSSSVAAPSQSVTAQEGGASSAKMSIAALFAGILFFL